MGVGRGEPIDRRGRRAPGMGGPRADHLRRMNRTFAILVVTILGLAGSGRARGESSETLASRFAAVSAGASGGRCSRSGRSAARGPSSRAASASTPARTARSEERPAGRASLEDENLRTRLLIALRRYETADSALALRTHVRDRREFYLHQLRRARVNALSGRDDRALDLCSVSTACRTRSSIRTETFSSVDALLRSGRPADAVDGGARSASRRGSRGR